MGVDEVDACGGEVGGEAESSGAACTLLLANSLGRDQFDLILQPQPLAKHHGLLSVHECVYYSSCMRVCMILVYECVYHISVRVCLSY